eukprot:11448657-Prorocentrum_lima.AAC.1
MKHEQFPHTGHVYTHQDHYVLELSEIDTKHLDLTQLEDDCDAENAREIQKPLGCISLASYEPGGHSTVCGFHAATSASTDEQAS